MTGKNVTVSVDGREVSIPTGWTILDACRSVGVDLPTLCHGPTLEPANACRVCVVELDGSRALVPSCSREAEEGMEILTGSSRVETSRRLVVELLESAAELDRVADHSELRSKVGARPDRFGPSQPEHARVKPTAGHHSEPDPGTAATVAEPVKIEDELYVRDYSRCILCYRCVDACGVQHQNTFAISVAGRGFDARISTEFDVELPESACVYCGNCIAVCPTGALVGKVEFDMRELGTWDGPRQETTRTVCPYCGVGCNLEVHTQDGTVVKVTSPSDHDVTLGNLCVKGRFGLSFVSSGLDE